MIKTEHPFIRDDGTEDAGLVKTFTDTEGKVLKQIETGIVYGDAVIDIYPCPYTYEEVDAPEEETEEEHEEEQGDGEEQE